MDYKSEKGAIIIEASLSLTVFLFTLLTVYTMFHVSLGQARISAALNSTAKELSQYAYVYELTGLNEKQANLAANGGAAKSTLKNDLSQIEDLYDAIGGITNSASSIVSSGENAESFMYYILDQGIDQFKGDVVGVAARNLMKKNLGSNADGFLRGVGIKNGINGLNFRKTRVFTSGEEDYILLDVRYQITVIKLLDIDMTMNFELCAKTRAWVGTD